MGKSTGLTLFLGFCILFLFSFTQKDHTAPQAMVLHAEKVYAAQSDITYYFYYVRASDYNAATSQSTFQWIDNDTGCVRSPGNCQVRSAKERVVILPVPGQ